MKHNINNSERLLIPLQAQPAHRSLFSGRSYLPLQRAYRGANIYNGNTLFVDKYMTLILKTKCTEDSDTQMIRLYSRHKLTG